MVVAIENQFGLKYFSGVREDHVGARFEGIEGYHRSRGVRTFGKVELERRLKKHFPALSFYYPFPDYKIPDFVLCSKFLASGLAGEMVSQSKSRDYFGYADQSWSEADACLELARNGMQEFFANSFLVFASKSEISRVKFDQAAIGFSSSRNGAAICRTRVLETSEQDYLVVKEPMASTDVVDLGPIKLVSTKSPWFLGTSLHTQVALQAQRRDRSLSEIFGQCRGWTELLAGGSSLRQGVRYVDGEHIDSIWQNIYLVDGQLRIADREWVWKEPICLNVIVIRAIYNFLAQLERLPPFAEKLSAFSVRKIIRTIGEVLGVSLTSTDFDEFVNLEARLRASVYGCETVLEAKQLRKFLSRPPLLLTVGRYKQRAVSSLTGLAGRLREVAGRLKRLGGSR